MLHRAREMFQAGQAAEAVKLYQAVISQRPDTSDAYRNLSFVLWQSGRPRQAIAALELALANGVTRRDLQVKLGTYLAEVGAAAKAIPLLETLPRDDTEALNALGIAYAHVGRPADAMQMFRRALEFDPTSGLAHQNIGTLHLQAGDLKAAEASLREALRIDPTVSGALTTLGVVQIKTGRGAEAVESWKRAVELEPTEFDALYNLTIELLAQGRIDDARTFGDRYLATAPPALYARDLAHVRKLLGR
jgi:Flp pilus assembly protein TadD